jgi:hypothetical protein
MLHPSPSVAGQQRQIAAALLGALATAACVPSCSSDQGAGQEADAVLRIDTTSAALKAFRAGSADDWAWAGGQFDAPAMDQAMLNASTPEMFAWNSATTTGPDPSHTLVPTQQNGQAFFLLFSTSSTPKLLQVFTSHANYTPTEAQWQTFVGVGGSIQVSLSTGTFENDVLTSDGGPHNGQSLSFTIQ